MRVFVLGAGVAKTYGCPVTKDLFNESVECCADEETAKAIKNTIKYIYPEFVEEYKNYPNIEDFLSLLEVWKEFNSKVERSPRYSDFEIEQVRRFTIRILMELLDTKLRNIKKNHVLLSFTQCLSPNDVIITFNWDLGIERALNQMDHIRDWLYRLPRRAIKKDVTLLKAHGSIDWFRTEDITFMSPDRRFPLDDALGQISIIDSWEYPRYKRRKDLIPFVIPPSFGKSFQQPEILGIWADIYRALHQAEMIYIFGYSLPQADIHAKFVLRAAIQNNPLHQKAGSDPIVTVFNPDQAVRHTFTELLGSKFNFKRVYFEDVDFKAEIAC